MRTPAWDAKAPVVPLTGDGSLQHYPEAVWVGGERHWTQWHPWEPFEAPLRLDGFSRGRSAAYLVLRHEDGRRFPMFLADLEDFLRRGRVQYGHLYPPKGVQWTVRKRGQNYGLALALEPVLEPVP